jgi:hypothetical protein
MTAFQRRELERSPVSSTIHPHPGAVLIGDALASALRALPRPANDILRPIADELEKR